MSEYKSLSKSIENHRRSGDVDKWHEESLRHDALISRINRKIGYKGDPLDTHIDHANNVHHATDSVRHGYFGGAGVVGAGAVPYAILHTLGVNNKIAGGIGAAAAGAALVSDIVKKVKAKKALEEARRVQNAFKHEAGL